MVGFGKKPKVANQILTHVQAVWKSVDPSMALDNNNRLKQVSMIEDMFYQPHYTNMKEQLDEDIDNRKEYYQASTISSRLTSLNHLARFLLSRDVYIGVCILPFNSFTKLAVIKSLLIFPVFMYVYPPFFDYLGLKSADIDRMKMKVTELTRR